MDFNITITFIFVLKGFIVVTVKAVGHNLRLELNF